MLLDQLSSNPPYSNTLLRLGVNGEAHEIAVEINKTLLRARGT